MFSDSNTVPVWDIAVRLFHWCLVAAFTLAYLTGEKSEMLHTYAGYTVLGLVLFRIFWGFWGGRYARFAAFVRGPSAVIGYLKSMLARKPAHYLGHNPAAGAMVLTLLLSLLVASFSGLKLYAVEEGKGPLAATDISLISTVYADSDHERDHGNSQDEGDEEWWEEVHEVAANLTLLLVFFHVLGVIVSSRLEGQNLARAMVTGRKKVPANTIL